MPGIGQSSPEGYEWVNGQLVPKGRSERLSVGERAAKRVDTQAPGYAGTALARQDSTKLGLRESKDARLFSGTALERAAARRKNPPEGYWGGALAVADSILFKEETGAQRVVRLRKAGVSQAKGNQAREKFLMGEIRKTIIDLRATVEDLNSVKQPRLPEGSPERLQAEEDLERMRAQLIIIREKSKPANGSWERPFPVDGQAAYNRLKPGQYYYSVIDDSTRQKPPQP